MNYPSHPETLQIARRESELDYPFTDSEEPESRYCWRCERETRQVRTDSGGAVWWMCLECNDAEQE